MCDFRPFKVIVWLAGSGIYRVFQTLQLFPDQLLFQEACDASSKSPIWYPLSIRRNQRYHVATINDTQYAKHLYGSLSLL
jgi:hypothetical protein